MKENMSIKRNSSIELLRIIAMFCIVLNHSTGHRITDDSSFYEVNFINGVILQCSLLGALGSNIFMIITGYFSSNKDIRVDKIIKLCIQVWLYSWAFLAFFSVFSFDSMSFKDITRNLFPIVFSTNWYISVYVLFCFFVPYINILLDSLNREAYKKIIIICLVLWGVIPTVSHISMYGSELLTFFMMFCIGGYLRRYPKTRVNSLKMGIILTSLSLFLLFASTIVIDLLGKHFSLFQHNGNLFYGRTSILIIGASIGALIIFTNINIGYNRFINLIGLSTLGVYLISENYFIRDVIWGPLFNWDKGINSPFLFVDMILKCALVFIISSLIEIFRMQKVEPHLVPFQNLLTKGFSKFLNFIIRNEEHNK